MAQAWVLIPWQLSLRLRPVVCGGATQPQIGDGVVDWGLWLLAVAMVPGTVALVSALRPDPGQWLALESPFLTGRFVVLQGGGAGTNHHAGSESQRRALDIVAAGRWGRTTRS